MQTLFIIDDNPDVLSVTLAYFTKKGYEAVGAGNGLDAIRMLSKVNPDMIITDIEMPQMDGFKLLKELKNNPLTSRIPILIISGHGQMVDSFEALGVDGFMAKPFSTKQLLAKVQEILNPPIAEEDEE